MADALAQPAPGELGSTIQVNSKRLLSRNLRKLGGAELQFAPRAYALTGDGADEFALFRADFQVSQALALLKRLCTGPAAHGEAAHGESAAPAPGGDTEAPVRGRCFEGLHGRTAPAVAWEAPGPDPSRPVAAASVLAALAVARRAAEALGRGSAAAAAVAVSGDEWERLRSFSPLAALEDLPQAGAHAEEARRLLRALAGPWQLGLLRANAWLLKPSLNGGGNGRGILLLDRLPVDPADFLRHAAALGRGGSAGAQDAQDGCLLQKMVEEPHLLEQQRMAAVAQELGHPAPSPSVPRGGHFKYNLRLWVLASMCPSPAIWLHTGSYVDLAAEAFTAELQPASHITNLMRGHRDSQRYWPLDAFAEYLRHDSGGRDTFRLRIWPQARDIVRRVFQALQAEPSAMLASSTRLKRLGVDLLVDTELTVWLVEFNVLRNEYGLRGARGQDAKLRLAQQLLEDERELKSAISSGSPPPARWEDLSHGLWPAAPAAGAPP